MKRKRTKAEIRKLRREIGARGGAIGGRKRAERHTAEELREWASRGGQVRAKKLPPTRRREIAGAAGKARGEALSPDALRRIGQKGAAVRWGRTGQPAKQRRDR